MSSGSLVVESAEVPELERLRISEFGNSAELAVRFVVLVCVTAGLFLHMGTWHAPVWFVTYLAAQLVTYHALSRAEPPYDRAEYAYGLAATIFNLIVFTSLPLGLFVFADPVLSYCGAMGLITMCVFKLWNEDQAALMLPVDIGVGWVVAGAALFVFLPQTTGIVAQALVIVLTVTAATYFSMALTNSRQLQASLRQAAQRGIEAQKMEAMGRLSGGIAHDFNNILTVIRGNLELHGEVSDAAEQRQLISDAHDATLRAAELVTQLLSYAQRAPLSPVETDAASVVAELSSMSTRILPEGISVRAVRPTDPLPFRADLNRLYAALLGLVLNARDAMEGKGRLTISAEAHQATGRSGPPHLPAGDYVCLAVHDTGPGMTEDLALRAIEPFYSTKPVGEGSGLGLPSAKGFAEQSGGMLLIDSARGTGTSVAIYLPRFPART